MLKKGLCYLLILCMLVGVLSSGEMVNQVQAMEIGRGENQVQGGEQVKFTGGQIEVTYTVTSIWNYSYNVNIELKTGIYWYPQIEEKTAFIVQETGMHDRVIYSSFNHHSIAKIKEIDSTAETAWLFSDVILNVEQYAKANGVEGLHPAVYHMYMSDFMKRWNESGEKVRVWTVNNEKDMKNFIQHDLEAVITNYPDVALRVRREVTGC